jgi:uncharacterized protein YjfI (DUF2170 family)
MIFITTFIFTCYRVETNKEFLDTLTQNKHSVPVSPLKVLPPTDEEFTPIAELLRVHPEVVSNPFHLI